MDKKTCPKCKQEKPPGEFHRDRNRAGGLAIYCKACVAENSRAWYEANRERRAETARVWREANAERVAETRRAHYVANRERATETARAWREANRARVVKTARAWREANPEKAAEKAARMRAKYPKREEARQEVHKAVMRNDFPPASALVCDHCQEAQADHYHHHKGYAREHRLDVVPVCASCHVELHREGT